MRERESSRSLTIRRLTELENMRLMGGDDEVYYALRDIAKLSSSQIYHICGDGLVPQIIEAIMNQFKE